MSRTVRETVDRLSQHISAYLAEESVAREQVIAALMEDPPAYVSAANACHRANRANAQAEALTWTKMEIQTS